MINLSIRILVCSVVLTSCKGQTMTDVFKNENLPLKVNGVVDEITLYRGGNVTLTIKENDGKTNYAAVDTTFKSIVRKGDVFIKNENSNECIIRRNDSIIYLDCYDIPKEIRDSLGEIKEWPKEEKGKWQVKN